MSGRKHIVVDQAEWNRLQQQAANLAHVQRDLPKLVRDVREQTGRDLDRRTAQFDARQATVERALSGLSDQARRLEADTTRRLRETSRRMREELDRNTVQLRSETRQQLREQAAAHERDLEEERKERRAAFDQLQGGLDELRQDTARAGAAAEQWLADARGLAAAIRELPHERYAPDQLRRLENRLASAPALGPQGLSSAHDLYHDLSDLRFDVEQRDLAWQQRRSAAREALVVVEATIGQSRTIVAGTDDEGKDLDVDVNFWSRGALSRLAEEVRVHLAVVRDDQRPCSDDELVKIVEEVAPQYAERLEKIVAQAGTAVFASQLRANFADLIVEVLQESHFYRYEDSTYEGEDERDTFYARSVHGNGSAVVVQVEPVADDSTECEVRILSYDTDAETAETRASRGASIRQSLRSNGFAVSGIEEDPGEPEERLKDLDQLRREPRELSHQAQPGRPGQQGRR